MHDFIVQLTDWEEEEGDQGEASYQLTDWEEEEGDQGEASYQLMNS